MTFDQMVEKMVEKNQRISQYGYEVMNEYRGDSSQRVNWYNAAAGAALRDIYKHYGGSIEEIFEMWRDQRNWGSNPDDNALWVSIVEKHIAAVKEIIAEVENEHE